MAFPNVPQWGSIVPGQGVPWDAVFWTDFTGQGDIITEDADAATGNQSVWLKTSTDTDTDAADLAKPTDNWDPGGWLQLKCNDNASDLENLQVRGEAFRVVKGKDIYFCSRIACDDVSETNFVIGLASTDAALYAGANDLIGFRMDNDGNLDYVVEDDTNETAADTGIDLADATGREQAVEIAFWLNYPLHGSPQVRFYARGGSATTTTFDSGWITTNIPDDDTDLTPSIEVDTGGTTAVSLYVDYFFAGQKR